MKKELQGDAGFTLVEMMIAVAISGLIAAAIYTAYLAQQRTYLAQEQVAEMQQNLRAALLVMSRDIRMAGYDPTDSLNIGFEEARSDALAIQVDMNEDGDVNDPDEHIGYDLYTLNGTKKLGRSTSSSSLVASENPAGSGHFEFIGSHQPLAENIEALEFQYLDAVGNITTITSNIRSVRISILARSSRPDRRFTNTKLYTSAAGTPWGPYGDHYRRRLLITTIQCRNLGL